LSLVLHNLAARVDAIEVELQQLWEHLGRVCSHKAAKTCADRRRFYPGEKRIPNHHGTAYGLILAAP
jgi:hypothetical protein